MKYRTLITLALVFTAGPAFAAGDAEAAAQMERLIRHLRVALPRLREQGGTLDDLMITNRGDHLFVVVNAACKEADIAHMQAHLSKSCTIEVLEDRADKEILKQLVNI